MLCVQGHTALCLEPTGGYLHDCVINHNQARKREAMCADGLAPSSTTGPFRCYCPLQHGVAGADTSLSKPGLDLKNSIFSLAL